MIPEYCPVCKHKVLWWNDHKGHMITIECSDVHRVINLIKDLDPELARKLSAKR